MTSSRPRSIAVALAVIVLLGIALQAGEARARLLAKKIQFKPIVGTATGLGIDKLVDSDSDGIPDYLDPDDDNDGIPDERDPDRNGDGILDSRQDQDGDGIPDYMDGDDDGDGIADGDEKPDSDGDGIPDDEDSDDDNDGIPGIVYHVISYSYDIPGISAIS